MPTGKDALNIAERAAWTFISAFAGVVVATGRPFDLLELKVAAAAGIISVAKNLSLVVYGKTPPTSK